MSRAVLHLILSAVTALFARAAEPDRRLAVEVVPRFHGARLIFDSLTNLTASGQTISVTRLDFLLSNFALRDATGAWTELTNQFAFIAARDGRTAFTLDAVPSLACDRLRFTVGLSTNVNHSDVTQYPANHPLNPQLNHLHWGWMGGYVFFALEGAWQGFGASRGGYSYHLATDRSLMTVELPVMLPPDGSLRLYLDVDKILTNNITDSVASTHSRPNDALAPQLAARVVGAFAAEVGGPAAPRLTISSNSPLVAQTAHAYPLTFSRFFPIPDLPKDNPLTEEGVALGRRLFNDPLLSVNNSQSCATCHVPERGFSDSRSVSIGAERQTGSRHAPALLNLAWKSSYFWDGRAATLREQVLQPIQNPIEMHEALPAMIDKLQAAGYPALFAAAFGSRDITPDRVARALEQFLLIQIACNSKFDRVLNRTDTFTEEEQRGFELFHTEYDPRHGQFGADCFHCHGGPLLQNQNFANNGLDIVARDRGRAAITGLDADTGKFAVPSLRNVAVTGPYMHDGRFTTLEQVVEHYCTGVQRRATLDPNLAKHPTGGVPLSDGDKRALVAFLKTLTDDRFQPTQASIGSTALPATPQP